MRLIRPIKRKTRAILALILVAAILTTAAIRFFWPQGASAAWYDESWRFRKKLTIDHTKVSGGPLTLFPVLVSLTDPSLKSAQANGNDFVFTDSTGAGTKLPHEIEKFTQSTGTLVAWVGITLSSDTDTVIYMYYGNPSSPDQSNKTGVWDANYIAVYHMSETSGHHVNSTSTANLNSSSESVTQQGANIGIADGADDFNGTNSVVQVDDNDAFDLSTLTLEAWVKLDTLASTRLEAAVLAEKGDSTTTPYDLYINTDDTLRLYWRNTTPTIYTGASSTSYKLNQTGVWYYAAGTKGASALQTYINGVDRTASSGTPTGTVYLSNGTVRIGAEWSGGLRTDGQVDEVRFSNSVRSAGWLLTTYNTISSPSTFFTSGSEEKVREPVLNWQFEEATSTTAQDSSANNYDGTLAGATTPSWQTEDLCVSGKCLYFQGSTANVTLASAIPKVQTVSFWIKPKTNGESILDLDGGTHTITASSGTISATGFDTPTIYVNGVSGAPLVANTWQHVEVTTATAFATTASFTLGKVSSTYLNGFIDEFKLYDYARSAAQVKTDFVGRGSVRGVSVSIGSPSVNNLLSQGLVGYWKMDENTSTTTADASGNGSTATFGATSQAPAWATGKYGSGLTFTSAENDYTYVTDTSSLKNQVFTYSAWINPTGSGSRTIIGWPGNGRPQLRISSDGTLRLASQNVAVVGSSTTTVTNSVWSHIAVTYDSLGNYIFYVNGATAGSGTNLLTFATSDQNLQFGKIDDTSENYAGTLDSIRIYNRALSPTEVSQLYAWAPGPVGYWNMDENTGIKAYDSSGNGNTGIFGNTPTWTVGKYGSGLKLDGNDDHLDMTNATTFDFGTSTNFTIEAWIKILSAGATDQYIIANSNFSDGYFEIFYDLTYNTIRAGVWNGSGSCSLYPTTNVADNKWHHMTVVFNRIASCTTNDLLVFIDGIRESTTLVSNSINMNGSNIDIGGISLGSSSNSLNGNVDDVKIYNYARTAKQIVEDMNAGHPAPGSPVGSALGYWKFDDGYGTNVTNSGSIGSSANGTMSGTGSSWSLNGKYNKAYSSNADTDSFNKIDYGRPAQLGAVGNNLTISAWVKITGASVAANSKIFGVIPGSNSGYEFYTDNTNRKLCFAAVGTTPNETAQCTGSSVFTFGAWQHIAVSYNGASLQFYVNGLNVGTAAMTGSITAPSSGSFVTGYDGNFYTLDGVIDELKVYNLPLTAEEVKAEYNQGKATTFGSLSDTSQLTGGSVASNSASAIYCIPGDSTSCAAPVGEWKMDENTGIYAYDSSGNGSTGTLTLGPTWTSAKHGSGLQFDGSNDYVTMGRPSVLNLGLLTDSYTYSAWINNNIAFTEANSIVFGRGQGTGWGTGDNPYLLAIYNTSGVTRAWCQLNDGGTQIQTGVGDADTILSLNQWYYITCVRNVSTNNLDIYVNGVIADSDSTSTIVNSAQADEDVVIGASPGAKDSVFKGIIDEVRIYNYARTPAQIVWDYNRGAPVGWWNFNECTGTSILDQSGNGLSGAWSGSGGSNTSAGACSAVDTATAWYNGKNGKFGSSLDFDGGHASADDVVTVTNASAIDLNEGLQNGLTMAAWIYASSDGENDNGTIFSKGAYTYCKTASQSGNNLDISCGLDLIDPDNASLTISSAITTNTWNHIVMSWTNDSDDEISIWINGIYRGSSTNGVGNTEADSNNFKIGDISGFNTFDGQIDDVRIYSYELTATQIKTLYNENSAIRFGPVTGTP